MVLLPPSAAESRSLIALLVISNSFFSGAGGVLVVQIAHPFGRS